MRKILLSSAIVMALSSASFAGYAAESATLAVTGTITPASCNVNLSSTSIDFGTISASTLTNDVNQVAANPVTVSVACDAATAVAVQTVDNRASSAMTSAEVSSDFGVDLSAAPNSLFGLGTDSANSKIGILLLGIDGASLNGTTNNNVLTSTDKSTWEAHTVSPTTAAPLVNNGYFALGETADSTAPASVTNATYSLAGGVVLKKSDKYPSGEQVTLDGNITFSVVYL